MRKKSFSRFKVQRRLMIELPGLGKSGALEKRPYPPGQHGMRRIKYSDYRVQLEEKQKVIYHYGLREEQLRRFIRNSKQGSDSNWVVHLISRLERRLDNIVFRLGFAPSNASAKQLVSHRKVLVNGLVVDINSYVTQIGDKISLKKDAYEGQTYLRASQSPRLALPDFLEKIKVDGLEVGQVKDHPGVDSVPFQFEPSLFTEYYNARGG